MRCSRCDQPVMHQAVGQTPEGKIVFGWCLNCMEDHGCVDVEVASPSKRSSTKLVLRERSRRPWFPVSSRKPEAYDRFAPYRQLLRGLSAIMVLWGSLVFISGLVLSTKQVENGVKANEQSIPQLLIVGGGVTELLGIVLWIVCSRIAGRAGQWLRGTQAVFFGGALVILAFGIATHDARRDPWIVAAATLALSISALARWVEVRSPQPSSAKLRGESSAKKTRAS